MTTEPTTLFLDRLRDTLSLHDAAALPDGQLLERFVGGQDEAAFKALLARHGPMVWGVCLRVLRNSHDAEDAFQATFLVLARKAAGVRPRDRVGNWLYGVAFHAALKARAVAARRRAKESQAAVRPHPDPAGQGLCPDLARFLDQEVQRLPAKYRAPVVLCDLEGRTRTEAARQLGWPEGTVAGRLARARGLLARRLGRRGVSLAGGALAAAGLAGPAPAVVPAMLSAATTDAAMAAVAKHAGAGCLSTKVALLTEGVLRAMFLSRLKLATAFLLALGFVAGAGIVLCQRYLVAGPLPAGRHGPSLSPPARDARMDQAGGKAPDDAKASAVKKELKRLEGIWLPVAYESGGERVEGEEFKKTDWAYFVLTISEGRSWVKADIGPPLEATIKIDPAAKPRALDWTYTEGAAKGMVTRSIYQLNGNTLRIGTDFENANVRPRDFTAPGSYVLVYKRETDDAGGWIARGMGALLKNDADRAIACFTEAIRLNPKEAVAYSNRAGAYLLKGQYDRAVADGTEAIRLDPKNDQGYLSRGAAHALKGDHAKAIGDFTEAIRRDPNNATAYNNRAASRAARGEYARAVADYEEAIRRKSQAPDAYAYLADLRATCPEAKFRDGKKAVEYATKANQLAGEKSPNAWRALAAANAEVGDYRRAVECQKKAIETPGLLTFRRKQDREEDEQRLRQYEAGKPYRGKGSASSSK